MSISPPSDLILDVVRAADPIRRQQAAARLSHLAPAAGETFSRLIDAEAATLEARPSLPADVTVPEATPPKNASMAYQRFEAMALASMIEAAMPEESSAVFGDGTAGRVWKSMLAEQLGMKMAEAGGIGLAEQLAASAQANSITADLSQTNVADAAQSLLVTQISRGIADALLRRDGESG